MHRVKATKQKKTTSTLQKNKEKQNKHKNKVMTMKIREKNYLYKGGTNLLYEDNDHHTPKESYKAKQNNSFVGKTQRNKTHIND